MILQGKAVTFMSSLFLSEKFSARALRSRARWTIRTFLAGVGGELLYKPVNWPVVLGLISIACEKETTTCDLTCLITKLPSGTSVYTMMPEACLTLKSMLVATLLAIGVQLQGSPVNLGGWEVGGYATLTDVPFSTFGEGSFDKAIYVQHSIELDYLDTEPSSKKKFNPPPMLRDGGAIYQSS